MINNDVLRQLRYALKIDDTTIIEIFRLAGQEIDRPTLTGLLKKEDEAGFIKCSDSVLGAFLDELIIQRRGTRENKPGDVRRPEPRLTNNVVLKKLRIAFELKEDDMLAILKLGDVHISKSELTALFRKEGHRNYKECGDQFLRKFLNGLTIHYRR